MSFFCVFFVLLSFCTLIWDFELDFNRCLFGCGFGLLLELCGILHDLGREEWEVSSALRGPALVLVSATNVDLECTALIVDCEGARPQK